MKDVTAERRGRRALRALYQGDPPKAEKNARKLLEMHPADGSGWAALRGALAAQGLAADRAALRAMADPSARVDAVIDCIAGRTLSPRGLMFDPAERFPVRPMAGAFEEVATAAALRSGENVVWLQDRGGEEVERWPVLDLDGAAGPAFPVRYRTAPNFVASVRNAAVVGEGLVLSEDGGFIEEINSNSKPSKYGARRLDGGLQFPARDDAHGQLAVKVFDTPAFLMAGPTDTSFGDYLVNFAPRLAVYEAAGLDCPILVRWQPLPQVLTILEALGFGSERIIFHTTDQISLFQKLYAPCWPSRDKAAPIKGLFDIFRRARAAPGLERPLLYLDRRGNRKRPLANEEEVVRLFASRGFQIVNPATLTLQEVRRLFAAPACVAGPYGSAFLNLVFSGGHPLSLVLMPSHRPYNLAEFALWQVDCGNRFAYLLGEPPSEPDKRDPPWTVRLDKLEPALDRMMELIASREPAS